MAHRTRLWATVTATAALAALPLVASAQTQPPTTQYPAQTQPSTSTASSPQQHLDKAREILDSISTTALSGEASTNITQIQTNFTQLERAYKDATGGTGSGTAGTTGTTTPSASGSWVVYFNSVTRALDDLDIPKSSAYASWETRSGSGTTTGTTGTPTTPRSPVTLEPTVKSQLTDFRKHIENFRMATAGGGGESSSFWSGSSGSGRATTRHSSATGTAGTQSTPSSTASSASGPEYYLNQIESVVNRALGEPATGTSSTSTTGTTGTSGTTGASGSSDRVTISRAELQQIKMNLEQLRQLVKNR
jgi:hypothetical protein